MGYQTAPNAVVVPWKRVVPLHQRQPILLTKHLMSTIHCHYFHQSAQQFLLDCEQELVRRARNVLMGYQTAPGAVE